MRDLTEKEIEKLRKQVYASYDSLLKISTQLPVSLPKVLLQSESRLPFVSDLGQQIFFLDEIEDKRYHGADYFLGQVESREDIGGGYTGIVVTTDNGIEMFGNYSKQNIKSAFIHPRGQSLIINRTVLEKNPDELEGKPIDEVIGLNFGLFPNVAQKRKHLSELEYLKFYMDLWSSVPLLF